jgi:hypothetical protein
VLNEYNAVDALGYLGGGTATGDATGAFSSDAFFGRVAGNGGDWMEFVVVTDHVDMRGWRLDWEEVADAQFGTVTLSQAPFWADVRAGTILTFTEFTTAQGGLESVRRIHALCTDRGVPMWCGGMLETGIGRAHNIHLATMPGFVYPGDTASASRTYARDIVEQQLETTDGIMPVPAGAGIGVTLDRPFLDSVTLSTEVHQR